MAAMKPDLRQLPTRPWFPVAAFAIAMLILTAILDHLPKPLGVFENYALVAEESLELQPDKPIEIDFTLPSARNLRAFEFRLSGLGEFGAADVEVSKDGQIVASGRLFGDTPPIVEVQRRELLADGDRLTMRIAKAKLRPPTAEFVDLDFVPAELRKPHHLEERQPVEFEFVAPEANLDRIQLKVTHFEGALSRVRLTLENLSTEKAITRQVFRPGSNKELRTFEGANAAGDRLRLRIERAVSSTPKLRIGKDAPAGFEARQAGAVIDAAPLFLGLFDFPGLKATYWAWLLVLVLFALALRREESATPWFLIAIGLVTAATSVQSWLHLCSVSEPWQDPDRYAQYGVALHEWVFSPSSRPEIEAFLDDYPHSQTPFVPVLLALAYTLGASEFGAYIFVLGMSSFGVLVCVHHVLRRQMGLSNAVSLAGIVLLAANIMMLRSFARPSTDSMGLFLIVAIWPVLIDRLGQARRWQLLTLTGLMIATALARPPGPAYLAYIAGATLAVDMVRERRLGLLDRIRTGLILCVPPVVIYVALFVGFDWANNFRLNAAKSILSHHARNPANLGLCALVILNVLPLFWLAIRERTWQRLGGLWLIAGWGVFYLILFVVVKGAFMHRLFIPVIPVIVVLTCFGWERLTRWKPWVRHAVAVFAMLFAAVNLGLLVYQMSNDNYVRAIQYLPN